MADPVARTIRRRDPKQFGSLDGVNVGDMWDTRLELSRDRVHPPPEKGIYGYKDGARSIVISGGYEDDKDEGESITYTGQGGRDSRGIQVADQEFTDKNAFLKMNVHTGDVVRVIRGCELNSEFAPWEGFRYDGLYEVVEADHATGRRGFRICRYVLKRCAGQAPLHFPRKYRH